MVLTWLARIRVGVLILGGPAVVGGRGDEEGGGGVVGGAVRVVADGALGSVQVRGRREVGLIDLGGGGAEGLDVSEVVAGGYGAASDGHVIDCPDARPIGGAHEVGLLDSKGNYGGLAGFDRCLVKRDGGHGAFLSMRPELHLFPP